MNPRRTGWRTLLLLVAAFGLAAPALHAIAQEAGQDPDVEAVREAAEELGDRARDRLQPLPEGEIKLLSAVVMSVKGRQAQWRPDEDQAWKSAEVDDLLRPGARIRTGRNSSMTLRVGQNATILIDRRTRLVLPEIVQVGDTLRTAVQMNIGRADFKVDRIGLTNDFTVVTPSTTLAVRGTGMAVTYGGFVGTQVLAARLNEMFAIELRYFLTRFVYFISGHGRSSDVHMNPVVAELFKTFGPPRVVSALIEDDATPEQLIASISMSPIVDGRSIDNGFTSLGDTLDSSIFDESMDGGGNGTNGSDQGSDDFGQFGSAAFIAEFICQFTGEIFQAYSENLINDGLGNARLDTARAQISSICQGITDFTDEHLIEILNVIVVYCDTQHQDSTDVELCITDFGEALVTVLEQHFGG